MNNKLLYSNFYFKIFLKYCAEGILYQKVETCFKQVLFHPPPPQTKITDLF